MTTQTPVPDETKVKCGSCGENTKGRFCTCPTCDSVCCTKCTQCDCDRIRETMEDLNAVVNRTNGHAALLASLRVTLAGLRKIERQAA
jgi:hypothetical protein